MTPKLGFPRRIRLTRTDDFSSVFDFRKRLSGHYLLIYYRPNQLMNARLGLIVSRKNEKSSVARNYMRRVLREIFRHQQTQLAGWDVVIKVQKPFYHEQYPQIRLELAGKLNRIQPEVAIAND